MPKPETISLISSWSTDVFVNDRGEVLAEKQGGPGYFLAQAFEREGLTPKIYSSDPVTVEILLTKDGEFGRVPSPAPAGRILKSMTSDWTVVSSISGEWDFAPNAVKGNVCVDLQGFVRQGSDFGLKQMWSGPAQNTPIYCLKGTRQEMYFIPTSLLEDQKKRLLVITDGENGVELFCKGKRWLVPVQKLKDLEDTVGAGDTFLGHFVASMAKGSEPLGAVQYACSQTTLFLKSK